MWNGVGVTNPTGTLSSLSNPATEKKTRRERIATAILGGMFGDSRLDLEPNQAARIAISFSYALIEELDKEGQ